MHLSELYKKNQKLDGLRQQLTDAVKNNASDDIPRIFMEMCQTIGEINAEEYESQINGLRQQLDDSALYARGVRQLTTEERDYYQAVTKAMQSANPKQALNDVSVVFPQTIISRVMDDLTESHPLLSKINFIPTGGAIRMMMNTDGRHKGAWGKPSSTSAPSGWIATSAPFWRKLSPTDWKRASSWATVTISPSA